VRQRESVCAARDLEYQREREQQAQLREHELRESQATLSDALEQVNTLRQSKASAQAALEAHSNLVSRPPLRFSASTSMCLSNVCA
jgi:hypothetical protein